MITTKEVYYNYLNSKVWFEIREKVLDRDLRRCRACNSSKSLKVHHRVYPEIYGKESLVDLITLCDSCHELFHGIKSIKVSKKVAFQPRWYKVKKRKAKALKKLMRQQKRDVRSQKESVFLLRKVEGGEINEKRIVVKM